MTAARKAAEANSMKRVTEFESKKILARHGIPVTKEILAKTGKDAMKISAGIGYPVALKIQSPDILHKTDAGGVLLNLRNGEEVAKGFDKIIANAKKYKKNAKILGVLVQEMAEGHECIIGSKKDPQFGPVIMFGLGGIFVELLKDVSFRIVPITRKDAREMICEIKGYPILNGARGQKPADFKALENALLKVSDMAWKEKKLEELDINPLFAGPKGVKAADARMIFRK